MTGVARSAAIILLKWRKFCTSIEEILRAVGDLEIGDVAAALADHRGQAAEAAGLVAERDADAPDMDVIGLVLLAPGDIEPTIRRLGIGIEGIAIDGVDGHALAGHDDADDAIARQRMTTAGEMHRHAGDQAADRHCVLRRLLGFGAWGQRNDLG